MLDIFDLMLLDQDDELFPFDWNGKEWEEEDCDDVFLSFYNSRLAMASDGGVTINSKDRVFPDGSFNFE